MPIKKITSLTNPLIKELVLLRENKKQREKQKEVLLFTSKIVFDVGKKHAFKKVFITDERLDLKKLEYEELFLVTDQVMKKITALASTAKSQIAAVLSLPKRKKLEVKPRFLILDGLQDPLNVGSLIRSAHGLNWNGIIFTPNTADPFHTKAIRAAMGSIFFMPFYFPTTEELTAFFKKEKTKINIYLADLEGQNVKQLKNTKNHSIALILSNESKGPSSWTEKIAQKITIPLKKDLDSLNVAAAGAILLYSLNFNV